MSGGPRARGRLLRVRARVTLLLGVLLPLLAPGGPASAAAWSDGAGQPVRVGTEGTYPPFTLVDPATNELTG